VENFGVIDTAIPVVTYEALDVDVFVATVLVTT